jgi:hypothetical protein
MNFYISTFRYKVACISFFGAVLSFVNAVLMGTPLQEIFGKYGFSMAFMLILSFGLWRPAFLYVRTDSKSLWRKWGAAWRAPSEDASEEFRFERFYPGTKYALMRDPAGHRIATSLTGCNCADFRKKRVPCKHMIKLARLTGAFADADADA